MSYVKALANKVHLHREFVRFIIKMTFCFVLLFLVLLAGFQITLGILVGLVVIAVLVSKLLRGKDNWLNKLVYDLERSYEEGFPGKEAIVSLFGFAAVFVVLWIASYMVNFLLFGAVLVGILNLGINNNLASLILHRVNAHWHIFGTTLEYFLLSSAIGILVFFLLGFSPIIAIYLAVVPNLFLILPWLDHNLTLFLVSVLAYVILFI